MENSVFFVKGEKIVLKKTGTWVADNVEITHEQTRNLFFRAIRWDDTAKTYYLHVGYERLDIEVEDVPYFVTSLKSLDTAKPLAQLSTGFEVPLNVDDLEYQDPVLYLKLDPVTLQNFAPLPPQPRARFLSAPYYELLQCLDEDHDKYFIKLGSKAKDLLRK